MSKLLIFLTITVSVIIYFIVYKSCVKYYDSLTKDEEIKKIPISNSKCEKGIGVIIIATNSYFLLGLRFLKQWMKYCDKETSYRFYFFSDEDVRKYLPSSQNSSQNNVTWIKTIHKTWQDATNSKFENIIRIENILKNECSHAFYFDADTGINKPFDKSWFVIGDLVGGQHFNDKYAEKTYDRNPKSYAYIPRNTTRKQTYYYGAFFGGRVDKLINFCKILIEYQKKDKKINYEPIWNDESYINKYFHYNPPSTVLNRNFEFIISDKSGMIGNNRNTKNTWHKKYLSQAQKLKDYAFQIDGKNGKLIII